ncbi:hypothetical protein [Comamonas testosteroni]|uniref:hypothetical protein n=1 Tax=Comamonas testosteroni TaxID=285 RepID=UPI0012D912A8|nr:hypothetical protein [Comamonas testosteroni]
MPEITCTMMVLAQIRHGERMKPGVTTQKRLCDKPQKCFYDTRMKNLLLQMHHPSA